MRIQLALLLCFFPIGVMAQRPKPDPKLQKLITDEVAAAAQLKAAQKAKADYVKATYPEENVGSAAFVSDKAAQQLTAGMKAAGIKVRRSVKDKLGATLPALLQYSNPGIGKDSWSTDFGISAERDFGSIGLGGFAEYHYNDATGKLKDSLLAGLTADILPGGELIRGTAGFKRDNLVSGDGFLSDLTWYPYIPSLNLGNNFGLIPSKGWFEGRITPLIGLQFEDGNGGKGFTNGQRISARAGVGLEASLAPRYFGNRLTLATNFINWNHLDTSGGMDAYEDNQWYWVTALTYWFNTPGDDSSESFLAEKDQHFGITAGYTKGDNPDEGELNADLFTLGFSVKF